MSYMIEYQAACFMLPSGLRGLTQTKFLIATESGSNNLTETARSGRERRVRSWDIAMVGTFDQVLKQAVVIASYCEGGGLKIGGRQTTPEAYIGRIRRLLARPREDAVGHVSLHATVKVDHPLASRAKHFGLPEQLQRRFGEDEAVLSPPTADDGPDWGAFFRAVEPFIHDGSVSPCRLGSVWGLPAS